MDEINQEIIEHLREDGRASFTEIAEKIGVSEGTVRNRVQKMQENNIIEKFTVEMASNGSEAVVMVKLATGKDIEKLLSDFPEKIEIKEVAGEYDLILEIERQDNQQINSILDEIRSIEGVETTETFMVLNQR
jgi:DNA-binding Lrp family transcriptional regulator